MVPKRFNILIVGLGIGRVYEEQANKLGYKVTTIDKDSSKNADYTSIDSVSDRKFDLGILCTPNYTHYDYALKLSEICKNVLVEKPGFKDILELEALYKLESKVYIVKNNLYRDLGKYKVGRFSRTKLNWITKNRIPFPGSWFTNKELSYGGVKKDIYPHMLALLLKINNYNLLQPFCINTDQRHILENIKDTEYGTVNPDGVYDVEDYLYAQFYDYKNYNSYEIEINWASGDTEDISINYFNSQGELAYKEELGLCPNNAYGQMIKEILDNSDNYLFYELNKNLDRYIQKIIT